jgi:uncharacterized PurR-regulated membrane protein YhhQ (DUF165 family)
VDTLIFCSIAASVIGITDFGTFLNYVVVGFVYKTLVEFLFVPVTSLVIGWIKKREPSYGVPSADVTDAAVTGAA